MRVNFCCGDGFMTQHFLNSTQISSSLDQVRCKAMPKRVWTDIFLQSNFHVGFLGT